MGKTERGRTGKGETQPRKKELIREKANEHANGGKASENNYSKTNKYQTSTQTNK